MHGDSVVLRFLSGQSMFGNDQSVICTHVFEWSILNMILIPLFIVHTGRFSHGAVQYRSHRTQKGSFPENLS